MNKPELLAKISAARQALVTVLENVPPARRAEPVLAGGWSVKDCLVHINFWEGQLVTLLYQLRNGAPLSAAHFSGRAVDEINAEWFEKGKSRSWEMAWSDFNGLGKQIARRVSEFDERELNNPRLNPKLRGRPLWQWIENDTYGHEDEHREAIEAWLRGG